MHYSGQFVLLQLGWRIKSSYSSCRSSTLSVLLCRRGGAFGQSVWWQGGAERLGELASALRRDFMIRRLKIDVLPQLPAKRRQVVRLEKPSRKDIEDAEQIAWQVCFCTYFFCF